MNNTTAAATRVSAKKRYARHRYVRFVFAVIDCGFIISRTRLITYIVRRELSVNNIYIYCKDLKTRKTVFISRPPPRPVE